MAGVQKGTGTLRKFSSFLKTPIGALTALGAAAALVGVKATKMAAELDLALREVSTLLPGTVEDMNGLRVAVISLSTNVPDPPALLTKGLYQIISAGITDTADSLYVLEIASRAAVAGLTDTFTSADALTTVLNAFQLEASEAERVADIFFATIKEGKTTFPELAGAIGNVATTAALAGVSMEEMGAAIATNIAAWLCALVMLGIFLSGLFNESYATRRTWQWNWRRTRELFRVGWPAGLSMGMDVASWTVFLCFFVGSFGDNQLAAAGITGNILAASFMPTVALGIAVTAIVGQWIGRGDVQRARARYITALKIGVCYMTFMGAIFIVFRRQLIGLFLIEPEVIELGGRFLIFAALFQLFDATAIITGSALKGAGDTKWPMAVQIIAGWCIFLPVGYVLAFHTWLGVYGGWVGANVYIWLLGIALLYRFLGGRWKTINIFDKAPDATTLPIELAAEPACTDHESAPATHKDPPPSDLEEHDDEFLEDTIRG